MLHACMRSVSMNHDPSPTQYWELGTRHAILDPQYDAVDDSVIRELSLVHVPRPTQILVMQAALRRLQLFCKLCGNYCTAIVQNVARLD